MKNKQKKLFILALICALAVATFVSCAAREQVNDIDPTDDTVNTGTPDSEPLDTETDSTPAETQTAVHTIDTSAELNTSRVPDGDRNHPDHKNEEETQETEETEETEDIKVDVPIVNDDKDNNKDNSKDNNKDNETTSDNEGDNSEQGRQETLDRIDQYLEENDIDPSTAGLTGEICTHCEKPIWDICKHGIFNVVYPPADAADNYCGGTCHVVVG